MDWNTLFLIANTAVMPFWLLMVVAPRWRFTHRLMRGYWPVWGLAVLYAVLILPRLPDVLSLFSGTPELEPIRSAITDDAGFVLLWIHVLAFDLLAGTWVYLDGQKRNVPALLNAVFLFFTLMTGPLGFAGYRLYRLLRYGL